MERKAIVAGATGLVGYELVKLLLQHDAYSQVTVLVRRQLDMDHPRLEQKVVDFDRLSEMPADWIAGADLYCTLGTTMKKAGSRERFELVDYKYPLELGQLAKLHGAERMLIVTAMGADLNSMFFYSRVKGRIEADLQALALHSLHIFRPSLIVGDRQEHRTGEKAAAALAKALPFLFVGALGKYKPISARDIARSMIVSAFKNGDGTIVLESGKMAELASSAAETGTLE